MEHNASILDQFTRQAQSFAQAETILNEHVLERILHASECGPDNSVRDGKIHFSFPISIFSARKGE